MSVCIGILYTYLAYSFTRNNLINARKVQNELQDGGSEMLGESFRLKAQMIKWITWAALGFCMTKIADFFLIDQLKLNVLFII